MRSIRKALFSFSVLTVIILTIPYVVFVFFHFLIVNQYDQNMQRIILEQNIPQYTADTIQNYYYFAADVSDSKKKKAYDDSVSRITQTFFLLDKSISSETSLVHYQGLKNLTNGILDTLRMGITESQKGNILLNSSSYEEANHNNVFVKEISGKLVLEELKAIEQSQKEIQKNSHNYFDAGIYHIYFYCYRRSHVRKNYLTSNYATIGKFGGNCSKNFSGKYGSFY